MTAFAVFLVLCSGFFHAVWNLYAKNSINKNVFLWYCQLIAVLLFLPWTVIELADLRMTGEVMLFMTASAFIHGTYMLLLAKAYTVADMSQAYPIMRGTSPLIVPLFAVFFLGERVSPVGWVGIAIILTGIVWLTDVRKLKVSGKAAGYALAVGLTVALYVVVDHEAVEVVPPVVLNQAGNLGNLLMLSFVALRSGSLRVEWERNNKPILLASVLAPSGYLLFLYAMHLAPVAVLTPIREIGTVFGTVGAVLLLKEAQGRKRIASSVLITLGIVVLGVWA